MGHATENTLESIKKGIELKADMLEIDVFKIKTGELVVFHDDTMDRITNAKGKIEEYNFNDLRKILVDGKHQIPTLEEVIETIDRKAILNIELKGTNTATDTYRIIEEFKKKGKTILFVSHDLSAISKYCDRAILLNQGVKLGEGSPKDMIDAYKQVLVGQYETPKAGVDVPDLTADGDVRAALDKQKKKQEAARMGVNPETLEYGTKQAEIVSYYITDKNDVQTTAILKGDEFTMHMKVKIGQDLPAPIFAFSIKNIKGVEITGTNTMFEKTFLESVKAGQVLEITFRQKMRLQGGDYLISLGVTGYEKDTFKVYHRLYDVLNITVVSDKDTVGYFDMESQVEVKEI